MRLSVMPRGVAQSRAGLSKADGVRAMPTYDAAMPTSVMLRGVEHRTGVSARTGQGGSRLGTWGLGRPVCDRGGPHGVSGGPTRGLFFVGLVRTDTGSNRRRRGRSTVT